MQLWITFLKTEVNDLTLHLIKYHYKNYKTTSEVLRPVEKQSRFGILLFTILCLEMIPCIHSRVLSFF